MHHVTLMKMKGHESKKPRKMKPEERNRDKHKPDFSEARRKKRGEDS